MPFDFDTYQTKCEGLTPEQLHREWENYTRQISGGATSTATAVLFSPLTAGISLVGLGLSAPRIHNARKKRAIIEAKLQAHGQTHNTRKRDVIAPMAISGAIGGLTLGLAGPGADMIAGEAVGKGAEYAAAHVALDATGAVVEHKHDEHSKKKADQRMTLQYQNFQQQFIKEQAAQGIHLQPQSQLPGYQPGQQIPSGQQLQPPIQMLPQPENGNPGLQNYQPPPPLQDQKYEYVPIPAPQSGAISYQPASHQQTFTPSGLQSQTTTYQQLPPYSPIQHAGPPSTTHAVHSQDLSSVRRQSVHQPNFASQADPSPCPTPLPAYSQSPAPWSQQDPDSQSRPVSPILDRKPIALQSPTVSTISDYKSAVMTSPPLDVFELPAELVTAAAPQDDSVPAVASMEDEIMMLKARILQMEIEKRGGVIDIVPAHANQFEDQLESQSLLEQTSESHPTNEQQVAQTELKVTTEVTHVRMQSSSSPPAASVVVEDPVEYHASGVEVKITSEIVDDFEPLSYYPPPPASPAPPPSLLPDVPVLQAEGRESPISSNVLLLSHPPPQSQSEAFANFAAERNDDAVSPPSRYYDDPYPAPLNVAPIRQQTTPLPAQSIPPQQPAPRHASLTTSYQSQYSAPSEQRPALPSRPQSQIFYPTASLANYSAPINQQPHYYPPPPPSPQPQQNLPQPQLQQSRQENTWQAQYAVVSNNSASVGYNPQTYSSPPTQPLQQQHASTSRPVSVYQPLQFPTAQRPTPTPPQQQQQNYPPPPPSPNPQQQRPAPPPRPQSVYSPQYAPPTQSPALAPAPRPQSVYQPQYAPPVPSAAPIAHQQQQAAPTSRPQSVYQPLSFQSAQNFAQNTPQQQQPQQQIYAQPIKDSPIQRQDSGYYSIPPSRHSSSFSTTSFSNYGNSPQILSPQSTGMLSPQSTGSVYHGRSASVSTMGFSSPSPVTPQNQQQPYFPPPPGAPGQPPAQQDYFNAKISAPATNQGAPHQVYNPGVNQVQQGQAQGQGSGTQGWQWGMPAPVGVRPEPNYGAPPPVPQPWRSS